MELSVRETEVIFEIIKGNLVKEAADNLFISKRTAETHLNNAKKKTGARNIAELVKLFILSRKDMFFALMFTAVQFLAIISETEEVQRTARKSKTNRTTKVKKK